MSNVYVCILEFVSVLIFVICATIYIVLFGLLRRASTEIRTSRPVNVPFVGVTSDAYCNKSLLNVDGNYFSKSKRKRLLIAAAFRPAICQ